MKMCRSVQNEYSPNKYQLLTCQMSSVSSNIFVVRIVNRYSILHTTTKTHYRKVSNNNIYNIYLVRFIKKTFLFSKFALFKRFLLRLEVLLNRTAHCGAQFARLSNIIFRNQYLPTILNYDSKNSTRSGRALRKCHFSFDDILVSRMNCTITKNSI